MKLLSSHLLKSRKPVEIKKSYDYKFKNGMIAYKGVVFAGGNTTSYRGFMRIKKAEPSV